MEEPQRENCSTDGSFTSEELARFVIDALLRAGALPLEKVELAIAVATEEIEIRNFSGDIQFP